MSERTTRALRRRLGRLLVVAALLLTGCGGRTGEPTIEHPDTINPTPTSGSTSQSP
jgi:outer membrane biogenesis lipoprotein LolB